MMRAPLGLFLVLLPCFASSRSGPWERALCATQEERPRSAAPADPDAPQPFSGLWRTDFGRLRLHQEGDRVRGSYEHGAGSSIEGRVEQGRLLFRYAEPGAQGEGWFEATADGGLLGRWRADGEEGWSAWNGAPIRPREGRVWLVVLEAPWEQRLSEPEYAFADMLAAYFEMATARHVEVRRRSFYDPADLERWCREVAFLEGPVVLLVSSHGDAEGLRVGEHSLGADVLARGLRGAWNLELLHLSGCAMSSGGMPAALHAALAGGPRFPISGYRTFVDWDASALGDLTYLTLLLIRRLPPAEAVRQACRLSPYVGAAVPEGAAFVPLGLDLREAPEEREGGR